MSKQQFIGEVSPSNTVDTIDAKTSEPKVERVLRWFEKKESNLVGEKVLDNIKIEQLQHLFKISPDNPMYDCYPVETSEQIEYFQKLLNFQLDPQSYEYFIECDAASNMIQIESESSIS